MKTLAALFLFLPSLAFGQTFFEGALFATHVTESGPAVPRNESFSTNWFTAGVTRGSMTFRVRGSLEPLTIKREGYPQLLQFISPESGGPLVDAMRAHDLLGEVAVDMRYRALHLYVAPVGEPPLGAEPSERRASSTEFAEGPFTYDVAEGWRHATRVVAAGIQTGIFQLDGGVFHEAVTSDRHTSLEDGSIDSWSARAVIAPTPDVELQLSHGVLGDAKEKVTSASLSKTTRRIAVAGLWTRRGQRNAYGAEATAHLGRNVVMGRAEQIDNRTHVTVGYIFDFVTRDEWRAGVGANVDYHTRTHQLRGTYGHKPQGVYLFARVRVGQAPSPVRSGGGA
jgi:hypothetical protein